jgi:hypothetical protein
MVFDSVGVILILSFISVKREYSKIDERNGDYFKAAPHAENGTWLADHKPRLPITEFMQTQHNYPDKSDATSATKPVTINVTQGSFHAMKHPPTGSAVSRKVYQPTNVP